MFQINEDKFPLHINLTSYLSEPLLYITLHILEHNKRHIKDNFRTNIKRQRKLKFIKISNYLCVCKYCIRVKICDYFMAQNWNDISINNSILWPLRHSFLLVLIFICWNFNLLRTCVYHSTSSSTSSSSDILVAGTVHKHFVFISIKF